MLVKKLSVISLLVNYFVLILSFVQKLEIMDENIE